MEVRPKTMVGCLKNAKSLKSHAPGLVKDTNRKIRKCAVHSLYAKIFSSIDLYKPWFYVVLRFYEEPPYTDIYLHEIYLPNWALYSILATSIKIVANFHLKRAPPFEVSGAKKIKTNPHQFLKSLPTAPSIS